MKKKASYSVIILILLASGIYFSYHRQQATKKLPAKESSQGLVDVTKDLLNVPPATKPELALNFKTVATKKLATMNLDEKIGQLFLARVPETKALEDLATYHLGGYLLFGRDFTNETPTSLTEKINNYQAEAKIPLFIASDEEGGTVTRLSQNPKLAAQPFPSPQEIYQANGLAGIKADLATKGKLFHEYGLNLPLAPVADFATDSQSFIYARTLGQDLATTSDYLKTVVATMAELKIGSTLKHFPGYGDNQDSHLDIVHDERSLTDIKKSALPPFIAGIEAGADSVLITHNIVTAIDQTNPASISPAVYSLLRDELSFKGVIMTDDFDMNGLKKFISQEDAAVKAIASGADLILSSAYQTQIPAIKKAVTEKKISQETIDAAVIRVLSLKYKLEIISN